MNRSIILSVVVFFVYLFFQVLILKNAVMFHVAFCFLYIGFLLLLPVETNPLVLMLVGFILGFSIDVFYDSLGLHALASVFIMYLRNYWLAALTPQGGYDANVLPSLANNGLQWFLTYAVPLIFLHHLVLFFTEAGGFDYFWNTLLKVAASTVYTLLMLAIIEYVFPGRKS
ncbi:MAG: Rod shape-determining protein MreD [Cyclobacteriaceae bacterium]|nr:Rod shape-determining protein MreD [Cyclobacteriaceae bacterium]